jgi:hypothetical protein
MSLYVYVLVFVRVRVQDNRLECCLAAGVELREKHTDISPLAIIALQLEDAVRLCSYKICGHASGRGSSPAVRRMAVQRAAAGTLLALSRPTGRGPAPAPLPRPPSLASHSLPPYRLRAAADSNCQQGLLPANPPFLHSTIHPTQVVQDSVPNRDDMKWYKMYTQEDLMVRSTRPRPCQTTHIHTP